MKRHFIVMSAFVLLAPWFSGGGAPAWAAEKPGDSRPAAAVASGAGQKVAPAAAPPAASRDYRYSAAGKSDPFQPFMETDPEVIKKREAVTLKKKAALKSASVSMLQQADVDHFRLVGIIGNDAQRTAVVVDGTTKKFYPLSVGTFIGLNSGQVTAIGSDRVIVTEPAETKGRKRQTKRITMRLYKEEEGRP